MTPVDKAYVTRRLTDWQISLPWDTANALGPVEMGALVTLVDGLIFLAVRDAERACAARAYEIASGNIVVESLEDFVRGWREDPESKPDTRTRAEILKEFHAMEDK